MLAAKEKTASGDAPFAEPKTRVGGLPPGTGNGVGGCSPVTSTHVWGSWHAYAETASGGLVNRYYSNAYGRFMTPDPYTNSGRLNAPQTWNRYTYTGGDPINRIDPMGLDYFDPIDPGNCPFGADFFTCVGPGGACQGFEDGDASSQSPEDGCGPPSGPCVGTDGFAPSPTPYCQAQGGPPTPPPPPPAPVAGPDCTQTLTAEITKELGFYSGGASPLNTSQNIQALIQAGATADVDPRFLAALAGAESGFGIHITWGPYNAWNNAAHRPPNSPYGSWTQAINGVANLIAGRLYFGSGLTTTYTIYPRYQGPGYQTGLKNLNSFLTAMGGNPNLLTDPCDQQQ